MDIEKDKIEHPNEEELKKNKIGTGDAKLKRETISDVNGNGKSLGRRTMFDSSDTSSDVLGGDY